MRSISQSKFDDSLQKTNDGPKTLSPHQGIPVWFIILNAYITHCIRGSFFYFRSTCVTFENPKYILLSTKSILFAVCVVDTSLGVSFPRPYAKQWSMTSMSNQLITHWKWLIEHKKFCGTLITHGLIDFSFITHWLLTDVIDHSLMSLIMYSLPIDHSLTSLIPSFIHYPLTPLIMHPLPVISPWRHWLLSYVIDYSSLIMHSFPIDNSFTWWLFIDVVDYALINHSRHFPPFLTKINKIRSHNLYIWFLIRYYFKLVLSSRQN